jgi:o-succinylbenzoate synthase
MNKLMLEYKPYTLDFKFEAGTSRGVMTKRKVWFLKLKLGAIEGWGEVAPLPRLSHEDVDLIEPKLQTIQNAITSLSLPEDHDGVYQLCHRLAEDFPSIRFGLEMAMLDMLNGGYKDWFPSNFTKGEGSIPINGLIWMGSLDFMKAQIDEKVEKGFDCIKMKIGAIGFDEELSVLEYIRKQSPDCILRVDANGAFAVNEAIDKLEQLSAFDLHSIEQPILPSQIEAMRLLCRKSQVPIALDEELIGKANDEEKSSLLDDISPRYIILKPSLLGGFKETSTWIELAEARDIGWWITSALESNLGLNAISQFTAQFKPKNHQGLGTGQLFHNNLQTRLVLKQQEVSYDIHADDQVPF